ncbi:MAG: CBS domain-containing protein [Desulfurococcales archaeon]|nr:CBS domain-containing protein [Desulfurococcales archaeon]
MSREAEIIEDLLVSDVMKTPVITMSPTATVMEAARVMVENDIGSIIVVDERERLLGIVTKTDIVKGVVARGLLPSSVKLGDIMVRDPYYLFSDATLREAAELMGSKGIGHLPILDPDNMRIVGIISKRDILRIAPYYIELVLALKRSSG